MSYENEKNIAGETETLSSDDQNVSRLLSNLKRVDAPKDFDFHLKARIANASPAQYKSVRFFPVLKYALPLALFLLVGAAFVLTNSYRGWDVPPVAETQNAPAPEIAADHNSGQNPPANEIQPVVPEPIQVAENAPNRNRKFQPERRTDPALIPTTGRKDRNSPGVGGFFDSTGRGDKDANLARILRADNSNSTRNPTELGPVIPLQFRQIFMNIGIDASDSGQKTWTVMKLAKNSIAERSGLRVGDVMEAIDDRPIDPLYKGTFGVKSISVRRDGDVVKIDIKN